jgi:hypothetical protein
MSGVSGEGVDEVLKTLARKVGSARGPKTRKAEPQRSWVP